MNPFVKELPGDKERKNGIRQVYDAFYSFVEPTPAKMDPHLIAFSKEVCDLIELDEEQCMRPEFAMIMSGETSLPQTQVLFGVLLFVTCSSSRQSYAQCYGGHQFGNVSL